MHIDTFTIARVTRHHGSNLISWNVDLNGHAFGQIWTYRNTATETHRFHAKTLAEDYADFATYAEAESFIRGCA